jgi:Na+-driven multidrug efflux pump
MLAGFGTAILAGYGIGARLEFMLTSVAFAVGIASVPMIGMAVGAERIKRARRIAWTAGTLSFVSVGVIGTFIAIFPDLWVNIFTDDADVRLASHQYLSTAAPMYAFIGLAMSMYFSSQGAAKVLGPVLAQTARLAFIAAGGCARRVVLPERDPDPLGIEARSGARGPAGAVLRSHEPTKRP